jgi:hypothetical protein
MSQSRRPRPPSLSRTSALAWTSCSGGLRVLAQRPGLVVLVGLYLTVAVATPSIVAKLVGLLLALSCLLRLVFTVRTAARVSASTAAILATP